MIDRDFEQVSEEHMKSMTKPEGPAQEPHPDWCKERHPETGEQCVIRIPGHTKHLPRFGAWAECDSWETAPVSATPAPSQPAGAREQVMEALDWWQRANSIRPTIVWNALCAAREALLDAAQTAAKDAEIADLKRRNTCFIRAREAAERERASLREALTDIRDRLCKPFRQKYPLMNTHLATIRDRVDAALKAGKDGQQ